MPRKQPTDGDPNIVGTPEIVGTPLSVGMHGGGLGELDGVDDAEELADGGASGLSERDHSNAFPGVFGNHCS